MQTDREFTLATGLPFTVLSPTGTVRLPLALRYATELLNNIPLGSPLAIALIAEVRSYRFMGYQRDKDAFNAVVEKHLTTTSSADYDAAAILEGINLVRYCYKRINGET